MRPCAQPTPPAPACDDPALHHGWCDLHEDPWICELCGDVTDEDPCRNNGCVWCEYCGSCDEHCRVHDD